MKSLRHAVLALSCIVAVSCGGGNHSPTLRGVRSAVSPDYPPIATNLGISGDVIIDVKIGIDGDVIQTTFVSGQLLLHKAAIDAAQLWTFEKAATETEARLTFSFRIMPTDTYPERMTPAFNPPYRIEVKGKRPPESSIP
jgi:TonB family protein